MAAALQIMLHKIPFYRCEVLLCDPCVRVSRVSLVNVNTTDATTGVSRLPPVSFYRSESAAGSGRLRACGC